VRVVSITANYHGIDLGGILTKVRQAVADAGTPPAKTTVDLRGQTTTLDALKSGFTSGLGIAVAVLFFLLAANFQSWRLAFAVTSTVPAVLAGIIAVLLVTGTTLNIQSAIGSIMAVGVAVANAILLVTFAERDRKKLGGDAKAGGVSGAVSRLRPIMMTSFAMIAGMLPMALNLGGGAAQMAPLGRAVVGGLVMATIATLFILPAFFALLAGKRTTSVSLDPDDPDSELHSPI
jgi:multidrug efflux pump subunit AcrB